MSELELLEKLKKNIISLNYSMMDAPYFGFNGENIKGVQFAIEKILNNTGITLETLSVEMNEKEWFQL